MWKSRREEEKNEGKGRSDSRRACGHVFRRFGMGGISCNAAKSYQTLRNLFGASLAQMCQLIHIFLLSRGRDTPASLFPNLI
jgi:hypothetical protein